MILQVYDIDGKLVINKPVNNENEGLGAGLEWFQQWANGRAEGQTPSAKSRKRPRHPNDTKTTWDIGIAWHGEPITKLTCNDGFIIVCDDDPVSNQETACTHEMTKEKLLEIVRTHHAVQEKWYCDMGPRKNEQEAHYTTGVAVVDMNVLLLEDWLDNVGPTGAYELFISMTPQDQREIWEASGFHHGINGYDNSDADHWWKKRAERVQETTPSQSSTGDPPPAAGAR
jgi:hypothetical protein